MPFSETILIVSDFDGSFYNSASHQKQIDSAKETEFELIARLNTKLGHTTEQVKSKILAIKQGSRITSSEAILTALSHDQWLTVRLVTTWYHELRLQIESILGYLPANCKFVIGSHTPKRLIQLAFNLNQDRFPIYGPEILGCCKPSGHFFKRIASIEEVPTDQCLYIGDRLIYDYLGPIRAGYAGAILTNGRAVQDIAGIGELIEQADDLKSFQEAAARESWLSLQNHLRGSLSSTCLYQDKLLKYQLSCAS